MEFIIKNLPTVKNQGLENFAIKCYQHSRKKNKFLQMFHKIEEEEHFLTHFEFRVTLVPSTDKDF